MATTATTDRVAQILQAVSNQISSIYVGGTNYPMKDSKARDAISAVAISVDQNSTDIETLYGLVQGGVHYIGKTTTVLHDKDTTNPISIEGESEPVTATAGALTIYEPSGGTPEEFIWDGNRWNSLGSTNGLGSLAFSDQTSASYTPRGTVGISSTSDISVDISAVFSGFPLNLDATVDVPGQTITSDIAGTSAIIYSTFVGKQVTADVDPFTPSGDVNVSLISASGTVGSVVKSVSPGSGTIGSSSYSQETETLSIFFGSALTSVGATTGNPSFSLDTLALQSGFTGREISAQAKFTAEAEMISAEYTPAGKVTVEVSSKSDLSVDIKEFEPQGTISGYVPISGHSHGSAFNGTVATITANPVPKA